MWGDFEGTSSLSQDDALAVSLIQVTGPAHIPLTDSRWQGLFLHYNRLVHLEFSSEKCDDVLTKVCNSMAKHAEQSSNLASLCLHVSRMVRDMENTIDHDEKPSKSGGANSMASSRIALVGRARATCGALNLLRILVHRVLVTAAGDEGSNGNIDFEYLKCVFTYRSREDSHSGSRGRKLGPALDRDAGLEILTSILSLISLIGKPTPKKYSPKSKANKKQIGLEGIEVIEKIPEIYDMLSLSFSLLLTMFSTQLYQEMLSSAQYISALKPGTNKGIANNYFLDMTMKQARFIYLNQPFDKQTGSSPSLSTPGGGAVSGTEGFLMPSPQLSISSTSSRRKDKNRNKHNKKRLHWSSRSVLTALLNFMMERPEPASRSISANHIDLSHFVVQEVRKEKLGQDGMYETHTVVMATSPKKPDLNDHSGQLDSTMNGKSSLRTNTNFSLGRSAPKVFIDATNKVIHLSSSILLLPFRLMTIALTLLAQRQRLLGVDISGMTARTDSTNNNLKLSLLQTTIGKNKSPRTNDVLWLTDSPAADMANALFLILVNNYRAETDVEDLNPFRSELKKLDDNRWESLHNGNNDDDNQSHGNQEKENTTSNSNESTQKNLTPVQRNMNFVESGGTEIHTDNLMSPLSINASESTNMNQKLDQLTVNFEHLFESFGRVLHNEAGALTLYTLIRASPVFAAFLAVRSDMDAIVMPLLRTIYYSSSSIHYNSHSSSTGTSSNKLSQSSHPFRSISHLYLILILLLIFSQDPSFGPDSFRRVIIPLVPWYKERHLKNISLGSLIVLSLLRAITFNLNRLQDYFLLNNCCAVLLNLAPHVSNLHPYAAMRLASITMSCMRRYSSLVKKNGGRPAGENDIYTSLGMYAEVSRTLLQMVKFSLKPGVISKNLHLVYSLVYCSREFNDAVNSKTSPFEASDVKPIRDIMTVVEELIRKESARTAEKAMEILKNSTEQLKHTSLTNVADKRKKVSSNTSVGSISSDISLNDAEDFTFTYEEEPDPEVFFLPYVWEVVVCAMTSSTLEWDKPKIKVFPLLEEMPDESNGGGTENVANNSVGNFSQDISEVV